MRKSALLLLPLLLTGCLEEKTVAQAPVPCFEMRSGKNTEALMVNKCTGETWMLSKTNLFDDKGISTGAFTYRWSPIKSEYIEAELTIPRYDSQK